MPWNGIGTFVLDPLYSPEINGTIIDAVRYNGLTEDIAAGLTNAINKAGENVPVANLPMGGFKHTGAAPAVTTGEYPTYEQVIDRAGMHAPTVNLPMGGFKHTNAAPGTTAGEYTTYEQILGLGLIAGVLPPVRYSDDTTIGIAQAGYNVIHPPADITARVWTLEADATAAWADGAIITFTNMPGAGIITITSADGMILLGTADTGDRTLTAPGGGTAVWMKTESIWIISGPGIT